MSFEKIEEEELIELGAFFRVFGDSSRLKILFTLLEGDFCVNCIAETCGMTQSAVSQQLKLLRASRLVRSRKEGRSVIYSLADEHISKILALGREHYEELS